MSWTTAEAIHSELERRWRQGAILAARVTGEALFPLRLRLRRPSPREVAERFGEVMDWARALEASSRGARGFGYELRREEVRNRVQGANAIPVAAEIPTEADALRLLRRAAAAERFQELVDVTRERSPALLSWLARRPLAALELAEEWERILAVVDWFLAHPRPGVYLRQVDVPGVDSKFIEGRLGIFSELLDLVLPEAAIDRSATGARGFGARFGLRG